MKKKRLFMIRFLAPAVICFLVIFLYPVIRTLMMSFNEVGFITDGMDKWSFIGIENYQKLFSSPVFMRSLVNVMKIWLVEGAVILALAMLFSVFITSGIKGKNFWRAMLYLPCVISAVALVNMWLQYVFNNQYGFFHSLFTWLGLDSLASFQWTSPEHIFLSMMIAFAFGSVGFYVLIYVAAIDGIPVDYFEAAQIEGAGKIRQFFTITLPLLKDVIKRSIVLYSAGAIGFFVYSSLFSLTTQMATVTPIVYMFENVFGSTQSTANSDLNVGGGAAVGVLVAIFVLLINIILDKLIKGEDRG